MLNNVIRTGFSAADLHGVPGRARSPGVHCVTCVAVLLEPEVRARVDAAAAHSGAKGGDQELLVVAADAVLKKKPKSFYNYKPLLQGQFSFSIDLGPPPTSRAAFLVKDKFGKRFPPELGQSRTPPDSPAPPPSRPCTSSSPRTAQPRPAPPPPCTEPHRALGLSPCRGRAASAGTPGTVSCCGLRRTMKGPPVTSSPATLPPGRAPGKGGGGSGRPRARKPSRPETHWG